MLREDGGGMVNGGGSEGVDSCLFLPLTLFTREIDALPVKAILHNPLVRFHCFTVVSLFEGSISEMLVAALSLVSSDETFFLCHEEAHSFLSSHPVGCGVDVTAMPARGAG